MYGPKNRLQFYNPENEHFKSKKAALDYLATLEEADDPPWRTDGHELIGKSVEYVMEHRLSGKRTVEIRQPGTVTGWISEEDTDRHGEPGYVCEDTGKPACLFHVEFKDDPSHPYRNQMIDFQDMEEHEVRNMLVKEEKEELEEKEEQPEKVQEESEETEEPPAKRARVE